MPVFKTKPVDAGGGVYKIKPTLNGEGGGSGTKVVTELPEVGEEHTVYELQETKVVQSLVPMFNHQMSDDRVQGGGRNTFVFNTTEEMQNTFNSITPDENYKGEIYLNYITEEDKLIGAEYALRIPSGGDWRFTEARKISDCKFDVGDVLELEDDAYKVILKEYSGEIQGEIGYHATLFNDEPYVFEPKTTGILLGTPTIGSMILCSCQEELPEVPEDAPSEYVFETIPYEKIINYKLLPHNIWYFTPKGGEVTEISYWIYTNDEWVNVDEMPDHNTVKLGVTCTNGLYNVTTLPLDTITVTYDDVDYKVIQYAETREAIESGEKVTYYGYIEVPMSTQDTLTHTIKVSTNTIILDWFYAIPGGSDALNSREPILGKGILGISIFYEHNA